MKQNSGRDRIAAGLRERRGSGKGGPRVSAVTIFAPAKLNLFLAVTGRRADGFHDLVSIAVPLDFGDELTAEPAATFSLSCDDPAVPSDESNLVLKAARLFAARTGWRGAAKFSLVKRIPMGAGLGGGSSDGVAALRALNEIGGRPLDVAALAQLAAELGSDCPLFLAGGPVIMRGRGERIESLPASTAQRFRSRRVLVFKPAFPVPTPWAYARMVEQPDTYISAEAAETRLAAWIADTTRPMEELLLNNMEHEVFKKFIALPALLARLQRAHGLVARMSGSGSACFAFLRESHDVRAILSEIRAAWGESAFVIEAALG
jgi:4-diphosphocytidyl-2-C-methyl-D-erythritol kinase